MSFQVQTNVALAPLVTLKTGGRAAYYTPVKSITDLEQAAAFISEKQLPFRMLGGGSNVLVSDTGFEGLIVHMKIMGVSYDPVEGEDFEVTVGAGESFDQLVADTVERGLWGLENLSHIPGSVGATPVQNVGAYGVEVADCIKHVTVFNIETKKITTLENKDCNFSYRHSIFKEAPQLVIVSVTFVLSTKVHPQVSYADLKSLVPQHASLQDIRTAVIAVRAEKFPDWNVVGTAGSFFKNPILSKVEADRVLTKYPDIPHYPSPEDKVKLSLGYILDKICGLKGFAIGPVRLYEKQALVLVVTPGATTTEIINFKNIISEKVLRETAIKIYVEVTEI